MTGAEYRRHLMAKHTQEVEKGSERGPKKGRVAEAFELLQALASTLPAPDTA